MSLDMGALYAAHERLVFSVVGRQLPWADHETVEDLTADTFLRALEKADRYRDLGHPPSSWLCQLARNVSIDYSRRRRRHVTAYPLAAIGEDDPALAQTDLDLAALERHDPRHDPRLGAAVERLTAEQRVVIEAWFCREQSDAETAASFGLNADAVKKRRHRALASLRRQLGVRRDAA